MLSPLMILAPVLTMISQALNVFNGWCLCYSGLTGDDMMGSARKAKDLIIKNGTLGLADSESLFHAVVVCQELIECRFQTFSPN